MEGPEKDEKQRSVLSCRAAGTEDLGCRAQKGKSTAPQQRIHT